MGVLFFFQQRGWTVALMGFCYLVGKNETKVVALAAENKVEVAVLAAIVGTLVLLWYIFRRLQDWFTAPFYKPRKQVDLALQRGEHLDPVDQRVDLTRPGLVNITKDIKLYVQAVGDPRHEMILFLHGGPGLPAVRPWKVAEHFAKQGFCCVFYDMRGCGRSTRAQEPMCPWDEHPLSNSSREEAESRWGLGAQVLDVERLRRLLQRDRIILYGFAFGGLIATMYCIEFPEHVSALITETPTNVRRQKSGAQVFHLIQDSLPADKQKKFEEWQKKLSDYR